MLAHLLVHIGVWCAVQCYGMIEQGIGTAGQNAVPWLFSGIGFSLLQQQAHCSKPWPFLTRARLQAAGMAASGADKDAGAPAKQAPVRAGAGTASRRAGGLAAGVGIGAGFHTLGDLQPAGHEARGGASRGRHAGAEQAQAGLGLGFEPLPDLPLAPLAAATPARADTAAPATAAKPTRCARLLENARADTLVMHAPARHEYVPSGPYKLPNKAIL